MTACGKELWEFFFSPYISGMPPKQNRQEEPQAPPVPQDSQMLQEPAAATQGGLGSLGGGYAPEESGMDYWSQGAEAPYEQQLTPEMLNAILQAYYGYGKQAALQKLGMIL